MTSPHKDIRAAIDELTDASDRLDGALAGVVEHDGADAFAAPSRLPGWTVGHVVTHLARNADGLRRVLAGAMVGEQLQPYASPQARNDDIESGALRTTDAILVDLRVASARLAETIDAVPPHIWSATVDLGRGGPTTADVVLATRLAEVEVHHHDLGTDPGLALLTDHQAAALLAAMIRSYVRTRGVRGFVLRPDGGTPIRLGEADDGTEPPTVTGPAVALVGWLSGRTDGAGLRSDGDLPTLPVW
jgi:maleylpyruvate isomerase